MVHADPFCLYLLKGSYMNFKKIPAIFRNVYFLTFAFFLFWMLFLDSNNFISQYRLSRKVSNLEKEKEFYIEKIKEVKQDREELFSDKEMLEKFAREKYLMKKETEDLYVIVEE